MMIAGGVEAAIHEASVGGFCSMKALSTRNDDPPAASRPFDRGRDGFVIGEGAGALILEALEHAEARGAEPLAEIIGYGATADASHITLPAPGGIGAVRAARRAFEKAGIEASEIDHVNAHATSTPEGDPAELQAIKTLFGDRAGEVAVTANKSMLGHTLGAAGAIEAIATILAIRDRRDPANDQPPRPGRGGRRPRPDPAPGDPPRGADGAVELVRLRRPEHRPGLPPVRRMTDEQAVPDAEPAEPTEPPSRRRSGRPGGRRRRRPGRSRLDARWRRRSLLALLDRLTGLLERSDLTELEVEAGGTGLVLRKAAAIGGPGHSSRRRGPAAGRARSRAAPGRGAGAGRRSRRRSPASSTPPRDPARRRTSRSAARLRSARSSG